MSVGTPFSCTWKSPICARKMTTARPLTKPSMTECGTSLMNLPSLNRPMRTRMTPARTTAANISSTPLGSVLVAEPDIREISLPCLTSATRTIAIAPVAPEIMPGLPPNIEVNSPMTNAA